MYVCLVEVIQVVAVDLRGYYSVSLSKASGVQFIWRALFFLSYQTSSDSEETAPRRSTLGFCRWTLRKPEIPQKTLTCFMCHKSHLRFQERLPLLAAPFPVFTRICIDVSKHHQSNCSTVWCCYVTFGGITEILHGSNRRASIHEIHETITVFRWKGYEEGHR